MVNENLPERRDDLRRINNNTQFDYKLNVLGSRIKKLDKDIISTRNCWDFVLNEINTTNDAIIKNIAWNQKRIELLKEINDKLCIYIDEQNETFKEYIQVIEITNNVNNINLNLNKNESSD